MSKQEMATQILCALIRNPPPGHLSMDLVDVSAEMTRRLWKKCAEAELAERRDYPMPPSQPATGGR